MIIALNWRAFYVAVAAIHTAIALFGLNDLAAILALIKKLASIFRHRGFFPMAAFRAGDG